MKDDGFIPAGQRLGYRFGLAWRWMRYFENQVIQQANHPLGKLGAYYGFLFGKIDLAGFVLLVSFWLFLAAVLISALVWHRHRVSSKDFLWHQAYGDPYHEYQLGRAAGQPELDQ